MTPAPTISAQQAVLIEGLNLGLQKYVAQLFAVLVSDPTGLARFELGLERAVATYDLALAAILENSATRGDRENSATGVPSPQDAV